MLMREVSADVVAGSQRRPGGLAMLVCLIQRIKQTKQGASRFTYDGGVAATDPH